ncbi:response regulator transcription factor [Portibacter marinus]|uniref:response regulator transcription factor n=1 Tax=Portibacter marinus TaxID=2898660 RepID=UPI001F1DDCFC|nr:response regulator transcription factor [Portibacter marinus]
MEKGNQIRSHSANNTLAVLKGNILIVEDDLNLSFLLMQLLQNEGYRVRVARNGLAGIDLLRKENFDLCLLDVMMPKLDGFNLAKHLKKDFPTTPFLFITARILKEDRLKGYDLGAEDYIQKPFDEEELICKIQVILRRTNTDSEAEEISVYQIGKYIFDRDKMELKSPTKVHRLTEIETKVMHLLCSYKNRILKREEAVLQIYGKKDYFLGRSFDVFISKIRKKLSEDPDIIIENVYKVGFIMNVPDE